VNEAAEKAVRAKVLELLPSAAYLVELEETRRQVKAHLAGVTRRNLTRLRPNDRVLVELSPHDNTRGRITRLL